MQSPIYQRILDERSQSFKFRQELIKKIQNKLNSKLVVYTTNPDSPFTGLIKQDIIVFEDLLISLEESKKCILMINSPGGQLEVAEKLIMMFRSRFVEEF